MAISEELKQLVKDEADKLKLNATQEELGHLDFDELEPAYASDCIYGQMTGSCVSNRAIELLTACAIPFTSDLDGFEKPKADNFNDRLEDKPAAYLYAYSPIEYYITLDEAKSENLIAYLKGESNTLEL